jgi:predicted dehydrogenase
MKVDSSMPYSVEDGRIVLETPDRPAGQQSVLAMVCEPLHRVRVGFIGLGMRGSKAVIRYTYLDGVCISALCDLLSERLEASKNALLERGWPEPALYSGEEGWRELCENPDIDLIYICTPWKSHAQIAVYAMQCGKHVAVEVPGAMTIAECWEIINTGESTRKHCMMLENCCYDLFEMTALNMAQQGLFGEILHVEGGYIHNIDTYWKLYPNNWRLDYNQKHRGDNYPTHGLGPACQVLNIHRGDRMDYLVSMDTKSSHGKEVAKEILEAEEFVSGDHIVTLIRTVGGRQIEIQHNVYSRRPYSRMYQITGSEGFACKYPIQGFALMSHNLSESREGYAGLDGVSFVGQELLEVLLEEYKHPITAELEEKARMVGAHGGMDFIMDYRLIYCLRNGLPLDQDVYDLAEWSCLIELSRISIESGSMPVAVPDFTRGEWDRIDGYSHAFNEK